MWFSRFFQKPTHPPLFLHNTLGKAKQEFTLSKDRRRVGMYNCGPTVYDTSHIGNLRSYVFADLVRHTLEYNGFAVKQVINITDFGHLSSDADRGEDKMSKALKREGMELSLENMRALADKYIAEFMRDLKELHIDTDHIEFPRASDHIAGEIAMVRTLEEKGYTYTGKDGVYFDTSRYPEYGKLGNIDLAGQKEGARVASTGEKKNPTDFLLWKKDAHLGWDSPWGKGFPGWHIECSAMISATLGKQIDIHTGGIDLMPTHHNNEIAQSESATGKRPFSRFWLHHEFLNIAEEKISKSVGNMIDLPDLIEKGYHPLALRYLFLTAHYRSPLNFTCDALDAAQTSFLKLRRLVDTRAMGGTISAVWQRKVHERLNDDIDTPGALAVLWEMTKDHELSGAEVRATLVDADRVLGLGFHLPDPSADALLRKLFGIPVALEELPKHVRTLLDSREAARNKKNWQVADSLRAELQKLGYLIEDTSADPRIFRKDVL